MFLELTSGKKLYYEIHGTGEPLLILNGIMMSTASWKQFVEPLSKNNQLILVDFLDQGQSDRMEEAYTHALQVEAIGEFMKKLSLSNVNLFGISYGGEIALQVTLANPDRIKRLLLFNTCAETTYWLEEVGNAWNKALHDPEAYYLTTIPFIYSPDFFIQNKGWMEERKQVLLPIFANKDFQASMRRLTDSSGGYSVKNELANLSIPTLIVGSEYDFVTPFAQQKELHENIRGSQLVHIPGAGHALMYEKPVLFQSLITGFIGIDSPTDNQ